MGSGGTDRDILEKKLEKRLQDPRAEPLISLPLNFLEDITCGFSTDRELGRGAYGVVYKGVLRSGKAIAVKKILDAHLLGNDVQVKNEIIFLAEVRHQNIVQLVGYCVETKSEMVEVGGKLVFAERRACLICFEFLCNGSLDKHLSVDTSGLDWDKRYMIIRGVCRGLHYLHGKHRIVHRDLKPLNILMDDTMTPKIGDFGLSRLLSQVKSRIVTANLQGTPGYMAPECIEQQSISFEADIYSLGVIIIEIIKGCKDYPVVGERTEMFLKHYTDKVVGSWRNRTPIHMSPEMHIQQVKKCISIALKCLEPESKKRPTSLDIVQGLDALEPEYGSPGNSPSDPEKGRQRDRQGGQWSSAVQEEMAGAGTSREGHRRARAGVQGGAQRLGDEDDGAGQAQGLPRGGSRGRPVLPLLHQAPAGRQNRSTSSRIDNAERKINNYQNNTTAGHLTVHDGLVPRTSTVMNNSGIVTNMNAKGSYVSAKQKKSMPTYNIKAGGSVNTYFGDSSSRNGIKEDSVAATQNNSWRVSVPAAGGSSVSVRDEDFNRNARTEEDAITMATRAGNRWYDRNGQATAGEGIQNQKAAATVGFGASQVRAAPGKDLHPRPTESNAGWSMESQASLHAFDGNRPWTPPPYGPQDYQYPYGAADDNGDVPYYYGHHFVEENPSSCSIM